jgi:type IV secretory pathway TrbD component
MAGTLPGTVHRSRSRAASRGMVTFELAIGVLAAVLVAFVLSWLIGLVTLQVRCADTAAQVARYLARDDQTLAQEAAVRAPTGAQVDINDGATEVTVTVTAQASLGRIGPFTLTGDAVMHKETSS